MHTTNKIYKIIVIPV